jgi:hypothetical protein
VARVGNQFSRSFIAVIAALASPCLSLAQDAPEPADAQEYLDLIEVREATGGPIALELIEPLTALGQIYFEQQDYELAAATLARARHLMRVNLGLDMPAELRLLALQVASEEALGHVAEAWELEATLLNLAERNLGSIEAVPVFRAAAEKRLEVLDRYRAGEFPPEIYLGCYYDRGKYISSILYRTPFSDTTFQSRGSCDSGDRPTVLVSLLVDARRYQLLGVESLLRNGHYASDELRQLITDVCRTSDAIMLQRVTGYDWALAELMERLLAHEPEDVPAAVRRAEFLLQLADMNVVRRRQAWHTGGFDDVHEQYVQAWQALQAAGVDQAQLDELFAPPVPVVLPAFAVNPLTRVPEAVATGYIDVSFEITDRGRSRRVDVTATSTNVQRGDIRRLKKLLAQSSYRPQMAADGQILESAPVSLRYYLRSGEEVLEPEEE